MWNDDLCIDDYGGSCLVLFSNIIIRGNLEMPVEVVRQRLSQTPKLQQPHVQLIWCNNAFVVPVASSTRSAVSDQQLRLPRQQRVSGKFRLWAALSEL